MTSRVSVVGHRGWPTRFPDNTLSGLLAAAGVADAVEIDVRRSADGKLVLAHDAELGGLPVAGTPWSTLAEIDLGQGHHPVLLDEALAAIPDTPAQLEVKNWPIDPGFEPDHRVALEVAERSRPGDVLTSFNPVSLDAVRQVFPDVRTGLCVLAGTALDQALKRCLDAGHVALVPDESLIHADLDPSVDVYPWTVNDPERARELVQFGVAGIITDDPGLMADILGNQR